MQIPITASVLKIDSFILLTIAPTLFAEFDSLAWRLPFGGAAERRRRLYRQALECCRRQYESSVRPERLDMSTDHRFNSRDYSLLTLKSAISSTRPESRQCVGGGYSPFPPLALFLRSQEMNQVVAYRVVWTTGRVSDKALFGMAATPELTAK
jgi:hypothetical protein